jgi:hypothetical protein
MIGNVLPAVIPQRGTTIKHWCPRVQLVAMSLGVAFLLLGLARSNAAAKEPIVGLWQVTVSQGDSPLWNFISTWTSDGLEVEDYALPILEGHICYGHWIQLKGRTYGQTHPYFEYDPKTGEWAGTSAYINYTVTVSQDGKTFTGQQNGKSGVPGPDPYASVSGGTSYGGLIVTGKKVEVDKSLLPGS